MPGTSAQVFFDHAPAGFLAHRLTAYSFSRLAVLMDANVHRLHYPALRALLPTHSLHIIPVGERYKTLATTEHIWEFMHQSGLDRQALVLAIGGGVTTDMGGFAAATWKRGIRFIFMPTTLLAMVDATQGGKLGIDFKNGKNLLGLFCEPEAVWVATQFLETLPPRELKSGFAEMLKHALISDQNYWQALLEITPTLESVEWLSLIRRSLEIKTKIVAQDPREQGERKLLNFGHTIGHALESYYLESATPLLHGEAVALGMLLEARLSVKYAGLPQADFDAVRQGFGKWGYPLKTGIIHRNTITGYLLQDKKNTAGSLKFSLLAAIGSAVYDVEIPVSEVLDLIEQYSA